MELFVLWISKEDTEGVIDSYKYRYGNIEIANHIAGVFSSKELAIEAWDEIKEVAYGYWIQEIKLDESLFKVSNETVTINKIMLIRKE